MARAKRSARDIRKALEYYQDYAEGYPSAADLDTVAAEDVARLRTEQHPACTCGAAYLPHRHTENGIESL